MSRYLILLVRKISFFDSLQSRLSSDGVRLQLTTPGGCGFFSAPSDVVVCEDGLEWGPHKVKHVYRDPRHNYWYDLEGLSDDGEWTTEKKVLLVFNWFV